MSEKILALHPFQKTHPYTLFPHPFYDLSDFFLRARQINLPSSIKKVEESKLWCTKQIWVKFTWKYQRWRALLIKLQSYSKNPTPENIRKPQGTITSYTYFYRDGKSQKSLLIHFSPIPHFYTPWKSQKTSGFLTFSGGLEMGHRAKMSKYVMKDEKSK